MEGAGGDYSLFESEPGDNQEGIPTQEVFQQSQGGSQDDGAHWTDEEASSHIMGMTANQYQASVEEGIPGDSVPLGEHTAETISHMGHPPNQVSQGTEGGDAEEDPEDRDTQHLSKEERRRLKKEKKKKDKEKKKKKKKKKKSHHDEDGEGEAHDFHERAETSGQDGLAKDDLEDDTLGGFIERDPEAAIHEAEDEKIPVEGGINSDNDASDRDGYGEHGGRTRPVTEFDRTLERLRQRKRRRQPMSDGDCQLYCNRMLQQMSDAMQKDEDAIEKGKPATAKLEMLDRVCTELVKPKWRNWFLTEGCCQCIATWLAPFKDNTLSNFTLRNRLLRVLAKLPISSQELMNNDLGRVLVLLWHHPDESDENRILIRQLIQRWTRPMLGLGSSHREFLQERDRAFEANDLELQQKLIAVKRRRQYKRHTLRTMTRKKEGGVTHGSL
ncbi:iws1 c-terminus protein [Cystoisospora suis]|uniref:Iws1 c-terminus protein n=1 Tax=Cystoisospora suis TaxID=483139 RepID=A0A2C6LF23_9APIC|nr:iws1 c-terminus protein [Cystoisospora suis]